MLDYQRIVDDVRSLLCVQGADAMDFLRAAAADYSVACDEVNERLHRCGALLRQGLRSEAIHLAEIEPNLLDTTALLDFPERQQWVEMATRCGMAAPTPLLTDVAAQLNEAYGLEQPLMASLRQHRLLALARGPLTMRIGVLRSLAEMDPQSPVWQEDLRLFEQERQKQLAREVELAAVRRDATALASLDAELSSPEWRNAPPLELACAASEAATRLRYVTVQSQFDELANALDAARRQFKLIDGRAARDEWNRLITTSGWQPQEAISQRAAAAFGWLNEQDEADRRRQQCAAAIEALATAVDHGQSLAELRNRRRQVTKLGRVPPELEEQYRGRVAVLERSARRRRLLIIAGVTVGLIAAVLLIGALAVRHNREQQVAAAVEALPRLLQNKQYEQAQAIAKDLPPRVAKDPRVREWTGYLQQAIKREDARRAEFTQKLGDSKHWLGRVDKSLDAEPGQTVLDRLHDELNHSRDDIEEAAKLARTDEDRRAVADARQFAGQVNDKWQQRLDRAFETHYDDLDRRLTEIERDTHSVSTQVAARLSELNRRLTLWEGSSDHVSVALQGRAATLRERFAALERRVKELSRQEEDERQVTAAVGDVPAYAKTLRAFADRHPSTDTRRELKRAAEESLSWQAVVEWNKLAGKVNGGGLLRLSPTAALELTSLADTVAENFSGCPESARVAELTPYLKAVAQRNNEGERIDTPLKKLFDAPLVKDVWLVETGDGKRYYAREEPVAGRQFQYVVTFEGKTRGSSLTPAQWAGATIARASQVAVAEKIRPILASLNDENWEKSFCQMISFVVADQSMDPILKAHLLQRLFEAGLRGSHCLEKAFGRHLEWLNKQAIDVYANWLDPGDATAADARREAARKLRELPDIVEARKAAASDVKTLSQRRLAEYRWVGWLHRSQDGRWKCLVKQPADQSGRLFTVYRNAPDEKPQFGALGRLTGLNAEVDPTGPLLAGRPVFLQIP